jgi:hypothetical protein
MNLIEQQTAAKDLPLQYLQQAVNGQNPNLTPWIATAELQRRTTMDQHMKSAQGPQGPMPTVKDQVEQKAGLMATQAAQLAQANQPGTPPPGPVPEGVPQPQQQPQQPVMAARGGLMHAPVHFNFAHGGILGYAGDDDGSYVDPSSGMAIQGMPDQEPASANAGVLSALKASEPEWKKADRAHAKGERYIPPPGYDDNGLPVKQAPAAAVRPKPAVEDRAPLPSLQGQGIKAALPKPPPAPMGARPPTPAVQNQPAPNPTDPMLQKATSFIGEPVQTPTAANAISQQQEYAKAFGTDKPVGTEERALLAKQQAAYDKYAQGDPDRAFAAYAAGLVGTPGSGNQAYQRAVTNAYAEQQAMNQNQLKNIAELNTAQRAANEKQQTGAQTLGAAATLAAAAKTADQAKLAGQIWDSQQQVLASRYNTDKTTEMQLKVHQMSLAMSQNQFSESMRTHNYAQLNQQAAQLTRDEMEASNALKTLVGNPSAAMMLGKDSVAQAQSYLNEIRKQKAIVMDGMQAMSSTGAKSPPPIAAPTMAPPPPGAVREVKKGG